MNDLSRVLIILGAILIVAGLLVPYLGKLGLGRLPGDIAVEKENVRFYFPLTTSIIISLVVTLLIWLFRR
jgi:membrane protein implicated in regulation of membrane protease activity